MGGTGEPRIAARALTRTFSPSAGVRDIDLHVAPGEIHALVGLNGAGKTTLMRLLLGMLRPGAGSAVIDGCDVRSAGPEVLARVGHLVGGPLAYGELDGRANLAIAARLHGVARTRVRSAVGRVVAEFDLGPYVSTRFRVLSQGNRQRVGLAAALVHEPTTVVLDEPTNALDPAGVILLRDVLRRRAAAGAGVLVSSHHLDEVARVADRITVVNRGRVVGALDPRGVDIERAFFAIVRDDDQRHRAGRGSL